MNYKRIKQISAVVEGMGRAYEGTVVYGLGEDNNIYKWDDFHAEWVLVELKKRGEE